MTVNARLTGVGTFLSYDFDETTLTKVSVSGLGTAFSNEFDENTSTTLSGSQRMRATSSGGLIVLDSINEIDPISANDFPTSGLQLYLDAGNSSSYSGSGSTWTDLSGNGRNATLVNGPTYSSSNGGILNFNGVDEYAYTAGYKGITGTGARTSIIFFKTSQSNISPRLFGWGTTNTGEKWNISLDATTYRPRAEVAGGAVVANTTTPDVTDQLWHMVASSVPASGTVNDIKLYVDGELITDTSITSGTTSVNTASGSDVSLGASQADASPGYLNGSISQFLIYNRQLSDFEIKIVHRSILYRFG
jgi:hypothetical protein